MATITEAVVYINCQFLTVHDGQNLSSIDIDLYPGCDKDEAIRLFKEVFNNKVNISSANDSKITITAQGLNNLFHLFSPTVRAYLNITNAKDTNPVFVSSNISILEVDNEIKRIKKLFSDNNDYSIIVLGDKTYIADSSCETENKLIERYSLFSGFGSLIYKISDACKLFHPQNEIPQCKN